MMVYPFLLPDPMLDPLLLESTRSVPETDEEPVECRPRSRPARRRHPGAMVLDDLAMATGDEVATLRVIARYAAVRFIRLIRSGAVKGARLRAERAAARDYLLALPEGRERRHLEELVSWTDASTEAELAVFASGAAEAAETSLQFAGARMLYALAFHLSTRIADRAAAARSARAVERLAAAQGSVEAAKRWRLRAEALEDGGRA